MLSTLKVGGFTYTVQQTEAAEEILASASRFGETDLAHSIIRVTAKYGLTQEQETLLHESLHAVAYHMGLHSIWGENEEQYVAALSKGLFMVMKDNPEFLAFLMESKGA